MGNYNAAMGSPTRPAKIAPRMILFSHPTGKTPETVTILALGPTNSEYHSASFTYDPVVPKADEVWTLNKGFRTQNCDVCFILDDLVGEARHTRYWNDIKSFQKPIITTVVDADVQRLYPDNTIVPFPFWTIIDLYGQLFLTARARNKERVKQMQACGHIVVPLRNPWPEHDENPSWSARDRRNAGLACAGYMKNSIPMILAYAGAIGVQTINLFGADYDFPGRAVHEADKPNAEHWAGILRVGLGVQVRVSAATTFLSTNQGTGVYGYGARQPVDNLE